MAKKFETVFVVETKLSPSTGLWSYWDASENLLRAMTIRNGLREKGKKARTVRYTRQEVME